MSSARNNIPAVAGYPIVGNVFNVNDEVPVRAIENLADTYGGIYKLRFFGREIFVVANHELLEEMCDEKRFWKAAGEALEKLNRPGERLGLFTAPSEELPDWQQAHRILVPAFGPLPVQDMFPEMHDIATQMILKWARQGSDFRIPVTLDFTRLTLDTIALCSMDTRFNSFYREDMHPFVDAMNVLLGATSESLRAGGIIKSMMPWDDTLKRVGAARDFMDNIAMDLVKYRRAHPTDKRDLLNAMINGKDPKTGLHMDDKLITSNMTTFLVAGHETTSGLLSFAFYALLKNRHTYLAAQEEVDRVVGRGQLTAEHLKDLPYLTGVLRETLRLHPTAPGFVRTIRPDNPNEFEYLAGGKYALRRGDNVLCAIGKAQRDPEVYGPDPDAFRPERMMGEAYEQLPNCAWQAFGTGARACIGRGFAWQEALAAMAMVFQSFDLVLADEDYQLKIKQTLTIKPDDFYMRATLREGVTPVSLLSSLVGQAPTSTAPTPKRTDSGLAEDLKPMTILYGSNTGTCSSLAQKLSVDARRFGYDATILDMDAGTKALPTDRPTVIVTASYEGQPPDNAVKFVKWLEGLAEGQQLQGVEYAVFSCGNSEWFSTFHRIPTVCDDLLLKHGATRLATRGLTDAAKSNIASDFEAWTESTLWPAIAPSKQSHEGAATFEAEIDTQDRSTLLRQDVQTGTVLESKTLVAPGEPEKRHLAVQLPKGMSYQAGDYIAILPLNGPYNVKRVTRHFRLKPGASIKIDPSTATFLPAGTLIAIRDILEGFVELHSPATRKDILTCIDATEDKSDKSRLQSLIDDSHFSAEATGQRFSLLDILEVHPSVHLTFQFYLSMLPPLRPRQYSISSSPLADPSIATVTYAMLDAPSASGHGTFKGVTSTYMASLTAGDSVQVAVRSTNKFFHLPAKPEEVPVLLFCAGSGLAPFRGFVQERAVQLQQGKKLAKAVLFIGNRSPTADRLYASELDDWVKAGAVDLRYAFSRKPEESEGCKYVQDRARKDQAEVRELWDHGAKLFICGIPELAEGVGRELKSVLTEGKGMGEAEREEWWRRVRNERVVIDVFA
nr:hypothetical protein B0A51_15106 [Rachicladosporium sp. CCFEE 5018]